MIAWVTPADRERGPEWALIQDTVEDFVQREIAPIAADIDRDNTFPRALWPQMGALGLLGITVPAAYGGSALGYAVHVMVMQAISRASAAVGLSYVAHSQLCMNQLVLHGTPAQQERYLPRLVSGEAIGALAMSEVGAGSDVVGMQLRAERRGDRYVLNGHKMWITNAPDADVIIVYAKTEPDQNAHGITAFVVEAPTPGLSVGPCLDKMGMRGSSTAELRFQDCEIPVEQVLGPVNGGVGVLMRGLDYERVVIAGGPLGIAQASLDLVLPYVRARTQFGKPIGTFELIQGKLADMYTAYAASQAYVYAVARACDRGEVDRKEAASAYLMASESATRLALDAVQILGGNGYIREYPAERYVRDAKLYEIGAGTAEIRRMLIGRALYQGSDR